jgi:addiction module RelE/StbE family toxin
MTKPIFYTKQFKKNYKKRFSHQIKIKQQISHRIELFIENRNSPQIRDHALVGTKNGERAFSITGDIRVIYYELEDKFVFIDIGTHSQVY